MNYSVCIQTDQQFYSDIRHTKTSSDLTCCSVLLGREELRTCGGRDWKFKHREALKVL